jgi:hypothetical protein
MSTQTEKVPDCLFAWANERGIGKNEWLSRCAAIGRYEKLLADNGVLLGALRKIVKRAEPVPGDSAEEMKRDLYHCGSIASDALAKLAA